MGIFSSYAELSGLTEGTQAFNEADLAEEMERLEEMAAATNLSDDPEEACIEAMMIGQENFHNLVMNITNEEVQYMLENGGEEIVYEGARLEALIDKIQTLIDKAWQKIKAIFEKAVAAINSWVSTDKRFVTKYGDTIKKASKEALTIRDTYAVLANPSSMAVDVYEGYTRNAKTLVADLNSGAGKDKKYKEKKDICKQITGFDTIQGAVNFYEEKLGLAEKATLEFSGTEVLTELKEGKDSKKAIQMAYQNAKKAIAGLKKQVNQAKANAMSAAKTAKDKEKVKNASYGILSSGISMALTAMQAVQRLQIRACNIYHSNCRKAAARAVRGVQDVKEAMEIGGAYEGDTEFAWLQ